MARTSPWNTAHAQEQPRLHPNPLHDEIKLPPTPAANDSGMTVRHTDWNDLSQAVRDLVEARTGPVRAARTASGGLNSQLAVVLDTADGQLFVKGLRTDHPGVVRQHREAMINPHVLSFAPRLQWQAEGAGWNVLAFTYIPGARHADYSPGSADVPAVVQVINRLQEISCPDLPVKRAERRWAAYVDGTDVGLLTGATLLQPGLSSVSPGRRHQRRQSTSSRPPVRGSTTKSPARALNPGRSISRRSHRTGPRIAPRGTSSASSTVAFRKTVTLQA